MTDHPSAPKKDGGGNRKLRKRILQLQTEIMQLNVDYRESYASVCKQVYDLYLAGHDWTDEQFQAPTEGGPEASVREYVQSLKARIAELEAK